MSTEELQTRVAELEDRLQRVKDAVAPTPTPPTPKPRNHDAVDIEGICNAVIERLQERAPSLVRLADTQPEIEVHTYRPVRIVEGSSTKGRALRLIAEGFLSEGRTMTEVKIEMERTGSPVNPGTVHGVLQQLIVERILVREGTDRKPLYRASGAKVTHVEHDEASPQAASVAA